MRKLNLSSIGLLQALGVFIYCALISSFFWYMGQTAAQLPNFLGLTLILALLVFSAALTGSLVFGYAAYLAFNKRTKEALLVLAHTLLYCLGILGIILIIVFAWPYLF